MLTFKNNPIRVIRKSQGLTLDQVAEAAGIHKANLSRIERGGQAPRVDTLMAIARALGVAEWWTLIEERENHE